MKSFFHYVALLDVFSQSMQLKVSKANSVYQSVIGAVFTVLVLGLTMPFLVDQFTVLTQHKA